MSNKRKAQLSDGDFDYLHDLAEKYAKKSVHDSRAIMLLIRSLNPTNHKAKQVMEYDVSKKMGDLKTAALILAEGFSSRRNWWETEITRIVQGLCDSPANQECQKIFMAFPHRTQVDAFFWYCEKTFPALDSKIDFLLQFLNSKNEAFSEGRFLGSVIENLIDLLMKAEDNLCKNIANKPETVEQPRSTPQSPDPVPSSSTKDPKNIEIPMETDEGEEGEVIEEIDDEYLEDEAFDDESGANSTKLLANLQKISVLNVYRMTLACDILPKVHRVRNTAKFSNARLQSLVTDAFQFLLTFAAQVPFAKGEHPEIIGLTKSLPDFLKADPAKYLRLYLDMASDLLNWSSTGPSFQVQPRDDLFEALRECFRVLKDLEHDSARSNAKKRGHGNISTVANQISCMFWALYVETGVAFMKQCSSKSMCPLNIAVVLPITGLEKLDLKGDDDLSGLLRLLQSLWVFRLKSKSTDKKAKSIKSPRKNKSVLEDAFVAFQPQSGDPSIKFSCLLDFAIRFNLMLAGSLTDSSSDVEDVLNNILLLSAVYDEEKCRLVNCLAFLTRLNLKPPKNDKDLATERLRLVYRINELEFASGNAANQRLTILTNQVVGISTSSAVDTYSLGLACIEQWVSEFAQSHACAEAACLALILHQNEFWTRLHIDQHEHLKQLIPLLKSDWSAARGLLVDWSKTGFVYSLGLVSLIFEIECQESQNETILEFCRKLIQTLKPKDHLRTLSEFLVKESKRIRACVS